MLIYACVFFRAKLNTRPIVIRDTSCNHDRNIIDRGNDMIVGLWKPSENEMIEARDVQLRALYQHPLDQFSDKIDRLLAVTARVRFDLVGVHRY